MMMAELTTVSKKVLDDASAAGPAQQDNNNKMEQLVEGKKKRLLDELDSALVVLPKDCCIATPIPKPNCLGFGIAKIEVIDETALLDSIPKNGKQSRRRASKKIHKKTVTEELVAAARSSGSETTEKKKKKYSREMMEAVRFVNVSQQHKFWKTIYAALQSSFADEYDTLVVAAALNNRHPLPFVPNKKPILTGVGAANGRCRYMNVFVH